MSLNYQMYGNIHKLTTVLITALCLFLAYGAEAQDTDALDVAATADEMAQIKDAYGFWAGAMFTKPFGADKKWTAGLLAQYHHITHEGVSRYDQYFARPSISYNIRPWLSVRYDMDLAQTRGGFQMRFMPGVSVSKRISDFSLSLRQQFYYIWYPGSGATAHLFTTKGSVTYSIPDTPLALSFAMEPLYREKLFRNRIFAGLNIRLNDHLTLCPQYLRKAYHNRSGKHDRRTYDDHLIYLLLLVRL